MAASDKKESPFKIPLNSIVREQTAHQHQQQQKKSLSESVNKDQIKDALNGTTEQLNNVKGIMELHPDLRLAMEILTSMILSPKDMVRPKLKLKVDRDIFEPTEKITKLLTEITKHLQKKTKLEDSMSRFIDEALFMYGANVWLFLPPNTLDQAISGETFSFESVDELSSSFSSHGLFAPTEEAVGGLSAFGIAGFDDNINILRKSAVERQIRANKAAEVSMESYGNAPMFRQKKRELLKLFSHEEGLDRAGDPIIFEIPPDVILPIHDPSDPTRHEAYLIQVDARGSITSQMEEANYFEKLQTRLKAAQSSSTAQEYSTLKQMGFESAIKDKASPDDIMDLYKQEVTKKIEKAVKESSSTEHFELKDHEPFYRLMFARAMEQQQTRLLYVPAYMVDYMAFDYDALGHGISLLEKTQLYSSLRAVVMFSDLIRQMNNSIPQMDLNITLDEDDTDPLRTVRSLVMEYGRISDRRIPLGTFSPASMMDELRRSGIRVNVEGGNKWPGTKLEVDEKERSITRVDDELSEFLKQAQYAGLGVPPEAIDQTLQGDFAINTLTQNQLFAKRAMTHQATYRRVMRERIRKYVYMSNTLYELISKTVGENKIDDFIDAMDLSLPQADEVRLEQQIEAYQRYGDFVDDVMEAHVSDTMLRGLINAELTGDALEEIRALFASHFKRQYLVSENILPELQRLHSAETGEDIAQQINDYHEGLFETIGGVIKGLIKEDEKLAEVERKALEGSDTDGDGVPNDQDEDFSWGGGDGGEQMPAWPYEPDEPAPAPEPELEPELEPEPELDDLPVEDEDPEEIPEP